MDSPLITVRVMFNGYGIDEAEADTPEEAMLAGQTLAQDIRDHTGSECLMKCDFFVPGRPTTTGWL